MNFDVLWSCPLEVICYHLVASKHLVSVFQIFFISKTNRSSNALAIFLFTGFYLKGACFSVTNVAVSSRVCVPVLKMRSQAAVWSCHVLVLRLLWSSTGVTIIMPNVLIICELKSSQLIQSSPSLITVVFVNAFAPIIPLPPHPYLPPFPPLL